MAALYIIEIYTHKEGLTINVHLQMRNDKVYTQSHGALYKFNYKTAFTYVRYVEVAVELKGKWKS